MEYPSTDLISINGVNLEYCWLGKHEPNKPTLVLLHEGLGSIAMWKDFPLHLASATGLSVFIYSRRGYGKSDPAILPREIDYMHDEALYVLPQLLDSMGIEQAIPVGHSDGGSISIIFAASDTRKRCPGLILLAAHVFNEKLCVTSIQKAKLLYEKSDLRKRLAKYHNDVDHTFKGWNDIWLQPDFMNWNIQEYLPAITIPILHIQGKNDEYGSIAQPGTIAEQSSSSVDIVLLDKCGHSAHFDQTSLTISSIQFFLTKYQLSI